MFLVGRAMKRRFVILVDWSPTLAGGEIQAFGTWQTEEAAEAQADRWYRQAMRGADGYAEGTPTFEVVEIVPKTRSRFRERLSAWLERNAS